jgi:putative hydrolase of HD superfamily
MGKSVNLGYSKGMQDDLKAIANYLFEIGILNQTPRSGFHFLGSGKQSVSEHVHRVMHIGFVLATMEPDINVGTVLQMCLFHDVAEARTSDLNWVHQKYVESDEGKALKDMVHDLPFGKELMKVSNEYHERKSPESLLAKDADVLELILCLKEQMDIGNTRAATWIPSAVKRLKTESGRKLSEQILHTNSDDWWYEDKDDTWWVTRNGDGKHA